MKRSLLLFWFSTLLAYEPYYTGPIIAFSGSVQPFGRVEFQPFLFASDLYGVYNDHWSQESTSNTYLLNYSALLQTGLAKEWLDGSITIQGFTGYHHGKEVTRWGDTEFGISFQLARNKRDSWVPDVRLVLNMVAPTGKYDRLAPDREGLDGIGAGSWTFSPTLVIRKWFFNLPEHPFRINLNLNASIGTTASVHGRSIYGGNGDTRGAVQFGPQFLTNLSLEYSITQKWVFALETIYFHKWKNHFKGHDGGARVGGLSRDQLSFSPEIEYNVNANYGWVGGIWFTAAGRNSAAFITPALSVSCTF